MSNDLVERLLNQKRPTKWYTPDNSRYSFEIEVLPRMELMRRSESCIVYKRDDQGEQVRHLSLPDLIESRLSAVKNWQGVTAGDIGQDLAPEESAQEVPFSRELFNLFIADRSGLASQLQREVDRLSAEREESLAEDLKN